MAPSDESVHRGAATLFIDQPPEAVFAAVSDVSRMGEWSPECVAGRWVGGADGPAVGAEFEGDNEAGAAGITVKRWTTRSRVTVCEPGRCFEFVAEEHSTWRYDFEPSGTGTKVTESFGYPPSGGFQGFLYERVLRRPAAMTKGMERTLERLRDSFESS